MGGRSQYLQLALVVCAVAIVVAVMTRERAPQQASITPSPLEALRTPNLEGATTHEERVYRGVDLSDLTENASDQPGFAQASHLIFHRASDETIQRGEALAKIHCASCHGEDMDRGEGVKQKILDEPFYRAGLRYNMGYKYGSFGPAVYRSIKYGTKNKKMPAFEGILDEEELLSVAHFVRSIQANNPETIKNR